VTLLYWLDFVFLGGLVSALAWLLLLAWVYDRE